MTEQSARGWFFPHSATLLAALVVGVFVHAALIAFPAVTWTRDESLILLAGATGLAVAWLLTALLWLFSDGSRLIFQFVFLGFWSVFALGGYVWAREGQRQVNEALNARIAENRIELRKAAVARAKETEPEAVPREDRLAEDRFARYRGQIPEATLDALRAADADILQGLRDAARRYEAVIEANPVDGPESWLRVATLDELEERRARHQAVYEASRAYNDYLDGLEERYEARLAGIELAPPADRIAVAERERLLQYWEYSGAREIRRLDAEIAAVGLRALDLLRDQWGQWTFDRASSRVLFEDPSLEFRFAQLLQEGLMLAREQARLEQQRRRFQRGTQAPD